MAAGEKTFSTRGKTAKRTTFDPPPPGEHSLKIRGNSVAIGCKSEPGAVPYVRVQLEALDTATEKSGGKNALVFHMMFTLLEPLKNGFVLVEKGGQLIDLASALGEEAELPTVRLTAKIKTGGSEEKGDATYEMREVDAIDAQALRDWLKNHDGVVVKGRTKNRQRPDGSSEGQIEYFIKPEGAGEDPFSS